MHKKYIFIQLFVLFTYKQMFVLFLAHLSSFSKTTDSCTVTATILYCTSAHLYCQKSAVLSGASLLSRATSKQKTRELALDGDKDLVLLDCEAVVPQQALWSRILGADQLNSLVKCLFFL